jgi:hypothetical protein
MKFLALMIGLLTAVGAVAFESVVSAQTTCTEIHMIQRGETLYSIARQYGTTVSYLQSVNNIGNPNRIYAGQRICVGNRANAPTPTPQQTSDLGRVTAHWLNVRTGPGVQYTIIRIARGGEILYVQGRSADGMWYRVAVSGSPDSHGWVSARYLSVVGLPTLQIMTPDPNAPTL